MPRITLELPESIYAQLERISRALDQRANTLDPAQRAGTIEGTARVALEFGLADLTKAWYREEFVGAAAEQQP